MGIACGVCNSVVGLFCMGVGLLHGGSFAWGLVFCTVGQWWYVLTLCQDCEVEQK
jgi:hypothetical protein